MSTWLYQLSAKDWSPETFRYEIWEGKAWHWVCGQIRGGPEPRIGDTIVFFYAPSGCPEVDRGFYGWAILERIHVGEKTTLYFLPTAPTNHLKMDPWWNGEAKKLADEIREGMPRATLFRIDDEYLKTLRVSFRGHLAGA